MRKPRLNHAEHLAVLRGMTPEQRVMKAFELTQRARDRSRQQLRRRYANLTENQICLLDAARMLDYQRQKSMREKNIAFGGD